MTLAGEQPYSPEERPRDFAALFRYSRPRNRTPTGPAADQVGYVEQLLEHEADWSMPLTAEGESLAEDLGGSLLTPSCSSPRRRRVATPRFRYSSKSLRAASPPPPRRSHRQSNAAHDGWPACSPRHRLHRRRRSRRSSRASCLQLRQSRRAAARWLPSTQRRQRQERAGRWRSQPPAMRHGTASGSSARSRTMRRARPGRCLRNSRRALKHAHACSRARPLTLVCLRRCGPRLV